MFTVLTGYDGSGDRTEVTDVDNVLRADTGRAMIMNQLTETCYLLRPRVEKTCENIRNLFSQLCQSDSETQFIM